MLVFLMKQWKQPTMRASPDVRLRIWAIQAPSSLLYLTLEEQQGQSECGDVEGMTNLCVSYSANEFCKVLIARFKKNTSE